MERRALHGKVILAACWDSQLDVANAHHKLLLGKFL